MKENRERKFDERRLYRRRRRIRNQIIAYITVVIFFAAIVVGAVFGIRKLMGILAERRQAKEVERQLEEAAAQAEQENAVVEPPAPIEEAPVEDVDWLEEIVETAIAPMPLEDRVAGLFIVMPEDITGVGTAITAGEGTQEALNKYAVGGLVYFSQNIKDKEQIKEMLSKTTMMSKYPIFLAVDEEGGSVRRVGSSGIEVTEVGDMADIGASGDTMAAYNASAEISSYLYELGFNLDFAPVADVVADASSSAMGRRSFGADPGAVGDMVSAAVGGFQDTGISSCLKHFPGIGAATEDTHEGMVTLEKTLDDLRASEFIPFRSGIDAGAHMVMVSHASIPGVIGDNTPCSLSEEVVTNWLRGELGYNGIIITDAMNMSAITEYYSADQAAVMALKAGADMILMPENFETAYEGVLAAVREGTISEERINESLKRIYRVKYRDRVDQDGNVVDNMPTGQQPEEGGENGEGTPDSQEEVEQTE
ncbi:glycoside hydrolase family 3 protein [Lachnospiraceae bacterium]|nr:glycoside hydrolase family 3 protein [Lachnospiraceae bacterium]